MLTNKSLSALKPGAVVWDEQVNGLHARCTAAGKKGFFFYYRVKGTKIERRPKLGDIGVLSIEQARKEALSMAAAVATGGDPAAIRRAVQLEPDMRHLCAKYLWTYARKKKLKGRRGDRQMIDQYVIPNWGRRKVRSIEYGDAVALHTKLKNKPVAANRVRALMSKMFNLAEFWKFRAPYTNPCRHVSRYPEKKRKVYVKIDEAPRIAGVLDKYRASRPQAVLFIYLLILTGARPDEIRRGRRDHIEPRPIGGVLRFKEHKTDGTVQERLVYLPPIVMDLIIGTPTASGSLTDIKSPKSLWELIRKEANVPHLRLYDLRHTFASAALQAGYTLDQIGELFNHQSNETTKRYTHIIDESAQEAAAETAAAIQRMMKPTSTDNAGTMSNNLAIGTK